MSKPNDTVVTSDHQLLGKAQELLSRTKPIDDPYGNATNFKYELSIGIFKISRGLPRGNATYRNHLQIHIGQTRVMNILYNDRREKLEDAWSTDYQMNDGRDWRDWFMEQH